MKRVNTVEIFILAVLISGCTLTIGTKYPSRKSTAATKKHTAHAAAAKETKETRTAPSGTYHTVRKGENLYRIAKFYGVQIEDIRQANHLTSDAVTVGRRLLIPSGTKKQPLFNLTPETVSTIPGETPVEKTQATTPVEQPVVRGDDYSWPIEGKVICDYGEFGNKGIDILAKPGSTVYAAREGKIVYVGTTVKYGETVIVDHGNGVFTVYGHDLIIKGRQGQKIRKGDAIGEMKNGSQSRRYLHFEIRIKNQPVNPWTYIQKNT
jgi:murein DD-endopeptidase MepM/ murein hydrolase activator NlpD